MSHTENPEVIVIYDSSSDSDASCSSPQLFGSFKPISAPKPLASPKVITSPYVQGNIILIQNLKQEISSLKARLKRTENDKHHQNLQLLTLQNSNLALDNKLAQTEQNYEKIVHKANTDFRSHQFEIQNLNEKIEMLVQQHQIKLEESRAEKQSIIRILEEKMQLMKEEQISLKAEVAYLRQQTKRYSTSNSLMTKQIQFFKREREEHSNTQYLLRATIQSLQDQRTSQQSKYNMGVNKLQQQLQSTKQKYENHLKEMKLLKRQRKQDDEECIVCNERQPTMGCYPCGHICFCAGCILRIGNICPMCKTPIKGTFKFYK